MIALPTTVRTLSDLALYFLHKSEEAFAAIDQRRSTEVERERAAARFTSYYHAHKCVCDFVVLEGVSENDPL